ncbi:radical SAM protein, partial [Candidatus Micrarchaeota archaeon]|nr:radical SAM protein [Candidatus Micrarchaeota archaeon]
SILSCSPEVVVYDYLLSAAVLERVYAAGVKNVLILRDKKESTMLDLLQTNPVMDYFDLIIVPHDKNDMVALARDELKDKIRLVGQVARVIPESKEEELVRKYGLNENQINIVASMGGGGYPKESSEFLHMLKEAHEELRKTIPNLRTLLFIGPYFPPECIPQIWDSFEIYPFDPDLPALFRRADAVVSEAGYNTVNDLVIGRVPSILVPAWRRKDDQFARAGYLQKLGCVDVCSNSDEMRDSLLRIITDRDTREKMVSNYSQVPWNFDGAENAAREIIELGGFRTRSASDELVIGYASDHEEVFEQIRSKLEDTRRIYMSVPRGTDSSGLTDFVRDSERAFPGLDIRLIEDGSTPWEEIPPEKSNDEPPLGDVNWRLVRHCNSKCVFCNHWRYPKDDSYIYSYEKIVDMVHQLGEIGTRVVTLNGGEPTLHRLLPATIKMIKSNGTKVVVNTNAIKFSRREYAEEVIAAGVDSFLISVHAPSDLVQEDIRGVPKSFSRCIEGIRNLRELSDTVHLKTNTVITKMNIGHVLDIVRQLSTLGLDRINLSMVDNLKDVDVEDIRLSREQFEEFYFSILPEIIAIATDNGISLKVAPFFKDGIIDPFSGLGKDPKVSVAVLERLAQGKEAFAEELDAFATGDYGKVFYADHSCTVPTENMYIMANGDVFPCLRTIGFSDKYIFGNIHRAKIRTIRRSPRWQKFKEGASNHEVCGTCKNMFGKHSKYPKQ